MSDVKEFKQIEMGVRLPNGGFKRNIFTTVDKIPKYRKQYNNQGLYVSAYSYMDAKNKTDDMPLLGHLYIDLDNPLLKDVTEEDRAFKQIREDALRVIGFLSGIMGIDEEMIKIYYSGQKGLHIVVPYKILGIQPMPELNHIFKLIAEEVNRMSAHKTIDTQIYDNARLFSLPGSRHPETGRCKIPLSLDELRTASFKTIKGLSRSKRTIIYKKPIYSTKANRMFRTYVDDWEKKKKLMFEKSNEKSKKTLSFMPPCIESILNRPCPNGNRNNTAAVLSSYFKSRGIEKSKAWEEMKQWNSEFANLPERELSTTFESIYSRDYTYGCSTLEKVGDCCKDKCKIGKRRIQKEKDEEWKNRKR